MKYIFPIYFLFILSCSSSPTANEPTWVHQPTRTVDNGYIVYVGYAEEANLEKAQFEAEGLALEDLANECSLIPNGTRLEDRYIVKPKYTNNVSVQIAVEFQDCQNAQHALTPDTIKQTANVAFTQQLKKYQDLIETGEIPKAGEAVVVNPSDVQTPAPVRTAYATESLHFFAVRQYVAYEKEIVILSPPAAFPPNSPQTTHLASAIVPASTQLQTVAAAHPDYTKTAWSKLPERPVITKPASLTASIAASIAARAPKKLNSYKEFQKSEPQKNGKSSGHHGKSSSGKRRHKLVSPPLEPGK